jgi:hypothetical protein
MPRISPSLQWLPLLPPDASLAATSWPGLWASSCPPALFIHSSSVLQVPLHARRGHIRPTASNHSRWWPMCLSRTFAQMTTLSEPQPSSCIVMNGVESRSHLHLLHKVAINAKLLGKGLASASQGGSETDSEEKNKGRLITAGKLPYYWGTDKNNLHLRHELERRNHEDKRCLGKAFHVYG